MDSTMASTSQQPRDLQEPMDLLLVVFLEMVICLTFLLGYILNILIVVLFFRRRSFRTLSNRFVLNLSMSNLATCSLLTPLSLLDQTLAALLSSPVFCAILTGSVTFVASVSLLATLLIGLDQYLAIVAPLHYHHRVTKRRVVLLCSCSWLLALLSASTVVLDPTTTVTYIPWSHSCQALPLTSPPSHYRLAMSIFLVLVFYLLPFLTICLTYVRIFTAARDNSVRTRRNSTCSTRRNSVCSVYGRQTSLQVPSQPSQTGQPSQPSGLARSPSIRSTANQLASHLSSLRASTKSRLSQASALLLHREETRAARVTVLVVLVVLVCWAPFLALLLSHTGQQDSPRPPSWLQPLSMMMLNIYTVISPLLYAYRSRRVQRDVALVFRRSGQAAQEKKFKKMRSLSCPQLVLTSCQSLPGPGASPAQIQACRSFVQGRRYLPSISLYTPSERDTWLGDSHSSTGPCERTPCISVTAPEEEEEEEEEGCVEARLEQGRASLDSGYHTPLSPPPLLSPHHLDVSL